MRFNVAGLLKAPTGEAREYDIDGVVLVDDEDMRVIEPVRGRVLLIREPTGVLAEGRLATRIATRCSRCLEPVEIDVAFDIEESFRPTVLIPGGPPVVRSEDDDRATLIDETHTLDLTEVVGQAIILASPMRPLCRADCPGLCPTCGHQLSKGPCACEPEPDRRWDALRELIESEG
jgi:uncharacterized protein